MTYKKQLLSTALRTDDLVDAIRKKLQIDNEIDSMTDTQIRAVCRFVGLKAPGTTINGKEENFSRVAYDTMISLTLYAFPWYYSEHELSQHN